MPDPKTIHDLIVTHGYWVLVVACLLEGETVLVLAGFAAHRGILDPVAVWAIAAAAGFTGDQLFFWLGRHRGQAVIRRWPSIARHAAVIGRLQERWHAALIIGVRFAYGLRIAGPILIGASGVRPARFAVFNAVGALVWATLVGGAGWLFGEAAERALGPLQQAEAWGLAALLAVCVAAWAVRRWTERSPS